MSTALIVRDDSALRIEFTDRANRIRTEALERAALIGSVRNAKDQELAVAAHRDIRGLLKEVESARVNAKEPILEYGRAIDKDVRKWVADLESEDMRFSQIIGDYQQEQLAIARRAQAERDAELRRIEEEKEAAIRKAAEDLKVKNGDPLASHPKLCEEIKRQEELSVQKIESLKPLPIPPKAKGQSVKQVWRFEVVDIWLLARTNPGLVRIEPNTQEINEVIARGIRDIAGLRIRKETISSTRSTTRKAIDV